MEGEDLIYIAQTLTEFFKEEPYKAVLWMVSYNPMLGGASPAMLIMSGRTHKVKKFVESSMYLNGRHGISDEFK